MSSHGTSVVLAAPAGRDVVLDRAVADVAGVRIWVYFYSVWGRIFLEARQGNGPGDEMWARVVSGSDVHLVLDLLAVRKRSGDVADCGATMDGRFALV